MKIIKAVKKLYCPKLFVYQMERGKLKIRRCNKGCIMPTQRYPASSNNFSSTVHFVFTTLHNKSAVFY